MTLPSPRRTSPELKRWVFSGSDLQTDTLIKRKLFFLNWETSLGETVRGRLIGRRRHCPCWQVRETNPSIFNPAHPVRGHCVPGRGATGTVHLSVKRHTQTNTHLGGNSVSTRDIMGMFLHCWYLDPAEEARAHGEEHANGLYLNPGPPLCEAGGQTAAVALMSHLGVWVDSSCQRLGGTAWKSQKCNLRSTVCQNPGRWETTPCSDWDGTQRVG